MRGEPFTLDFNVTNEDGSPYVLGNLLNPYLLITIASSKYKQDNRLIKKLWIPLTGYKKFKNTQIVPAIEFDQFPPINPNTNLLYTDDYYENVFSANDEEGERYVYYDMDEMKYVDYEFRVIVAIDRTITSELVDQEYTYSVKLLSGQNTYDYIKRNYDTIIKGKENTVLAMYNELVKAKAELEEILAKEKLVKSRKNKKD